MSSSVVLSPHTATIPPIPESASSSRPHRARATYSRSTRDRSRQSTSPVPTTASHSTGMSTRSRRSFSRSTSRAITSPEKASTSASAIINGGSKRQTRNSSDDIEPVSQDVAVLGLQLGEDDDSLDIEDAAKDTAARLSSVITNGNGKETGIKMEVKESPARNRVRTEPNLSFTDTEDEIDEGEDEIDPLDSPLTAKSSSIHRSPSRSKSPIPAPKVTEPIRTNIIRLVLGRKRKAEDEEPTEIVKPEPEESGSINDAEAEESVDERRDENQDRSMRDPQDQEQERNMIEASKRMPRKKRKWLKKGEVDPDDPIAVAKQQERFKMIDEALESLDVQFDQLLNDTHPQLVELWEELERRRDSQQMWLQQRHEAVLGDLKMMRDHNIKVTKSGWKETREDLVDEMVVEIRHKQARVMAERAVLRRNTNLMPILRAGRGAGGWNFSDRGLLSTGEQDVQPVEVNGEWRQRRLLPTSLEPLSWEEGQMDLEELGVPRSKSRTPLPESQSQPHRRSHVHGSRIAEPSRHAESTTPRPDVKPEHNNIHAPQSASPMTPYTYNPDRPRNWIGNLFGPSQSSSSQTEQRNEASSSSTKEISRRDVPISTPDSPWPGIRSQQPSQNNGTGQTGRSGQMVSNGSSANRNTWDHRPGGGTQNQGQGSSSSNPSNTATTDRPRYSGQYEDDQANKVKQEKRRMAFEADARENAERREREQREEKRRKDIEWANEPWTNYLKSQGRREGSDRDIIVAGKLPRHFM